MMFLLWNRGAGKTGGGGGSTRPQPVTTSYLGIPYSHTRFTDAITALAVRLSDETFVYWTREEMGNRIVQAIRIWQALTSFYRERAQFSLQSGDVIGDLHTLIPTRFGFSVTDQQLIKNMQYSLLEPATGNSWDGSEQWSLRALTNSLQRMRNQFLGDTQAVSSYSLLDVPSQPIGRVPLPDKIIDIRRAAWIDKATGLYYPLFRDDEFSALSFQPGWPQNPGVPQIFSAAITPPVSLQLVPPPLAKGFLELVTVNSAQDLDPTVDPGKLLMVPDDYTWAIEFGAIADLLSGDGLSRDTVRSQYADQIYQLGVQAAKTNSSVLMIQANDTLLYTNSVYDLDVFLPNWENKPGPPVCAAMIGRNLIAFGPVPDQIYSVTLDYVPNIPVPMEDGDYLQVGREHLEAILDCAQHLCAYKEGGAEFNDTIPGFQSFLQVAQGLNSKMAANVFYRDMLQPSLLQSKLVPVTMEKK